MLDTTSQQIPGKATAGNADKRKRIYLCEDSLEGILSAVHMAYFSRYGHKYITIELFDDYEPELFCDYINVAVDADKVRSVAESVRTKIGAEAWQMVHMAAWSGSHGKAQAIYRFLNQGFVIGGGVCGHLSDTYVHQVFSMKREVGRETEKRKGFVRFRELKSGVLFSKIAPKHHQLYLLGEHFADRLPMENWAIFDERRHRACLHQAGGDWVLTDHVHMGEDEFRNISSEEAEFERLWRTFFKHIEIKERINPRLQMNMMPKRYWSNMFEMDTRDYS